MNLDASVLFRDEDGDVYTSRSCLVLLGIKFLVFIGALKKLGEDEGGRLWIWFPGNSNRVRHFFLLVFSCLFVVYLF